MKINFDIQDQTHHQASFQTAHKPFWPWLLGLLISLIIILLWGYQKGYLVIQPTLFKQQKQQLSNQINQQQQLIQQLQIKLVKINNNMHTQTRLLTLAKREQSIQQSTNQALNKKLLATENHLSRSTKKLILYNEILAPYKPLKGLKIRHFGIYPQSNNINNRTYQYHLILSYSSNSKRPINGHYDIHLTGVEKNQTKQYRLQDLDDYSINNKPSLHHSFSLKYYRSLEGKLTLPKYFEPKKVNITLHTDKQTTNRASLSLLWDSLINARNH